MAYRSAYERLVYCRSEVLQMEKRSHYARLAKHNDFRLCLTGTRECSQVSQTLGWDPTWSQTHRPLCLRPGGLVQLFGQCTNLQGYHLPVRAAATVTRWPVYRHFSVPLGNHEVYIRSNGSNLRQLTQRGNIKGPPFHRTQCVVFTAYLQYGDDTAANYAPHRWNRPASITNNVL